MNKSLASQPVVEILYPQNESLLLSGALERFKLQNIAAQVARLRDTVEALESMPQAAIVAVLGSLNGGKSSCVSCFLSDKSRPRVARGMGDQFGTHRFVFWLPKRWDDRADGGVVWGSIENRLASIFGVGLEFLADDPEEARRQTNGSGDIAKNFNLPLIAFDERLNEFNLCLVDCPDVESKVAEQTSHDRLEIVKTIAPILQGVIFLVQSSDVRAEILNDLAEIFGSHSPSASRFLVINGLRLSQGSLASQFQSSDVEEMKQKFGATTLFGAYDFEVAKNQEALPLGAAREESIPEGFPWFFQVAEDEELNCGDNIARERMLSAHLRGLDAGDLWAEAKQERRRDLRLALEGARSQLQQKISAEEEEVLKVHEKVQSFLRKQMTDSEGLLKIPFTPELLQEIAASIERTAPFYAKITFKLRSVGAGAAEFLKKAGRGAAQNLRRVANPGKELKNEVDRIGVRLRQERKSSVFSSEDFATLMLRERLVDPAVSNEDLTAAWDEILQSLHGVMGDLPKEELDAVAKEIWKSIPVMKKVLLVLSAPVLLVGGLLVASLAVVDMGVSAVILSASMSNLAGLLGLGVVGAAGGTLLVKKFDALLCSHVAVPAYRRLLAATFDVFGLPRQPSGVHEDSFPNSGRFSLDLSTERQLPCKLPLTQARLAKELPGGWESLLKEVQS